MRGLVGRGEGQALTLLLTGAVLLLPNLLVIRSILGSSSTVAFVSLVIAMATGCGLLYGMVINLPGKAIFRNSKNIVFCFLDAMPVNLVKNH